MFLTCAKSGCFSIIFLHHYASDEPSPLPVFVGIVDMATGGVTVTDSNLQATSPRPAGLIDPGAPAS